MVIADTIVFIFAMVSQRKRKESEWVVNSKTAKWECRRCGYWYYGQHNFHYCPMCGSHMVGVKEKKDETKDA